MQQLVGYYEVLKAGLPISKIFSQSDDSLDRAGAPLSRHLLNPDGSRRRAQAFTPKQGALVNRFPAILLMHHGRRPARSLAWRPPGGYVPPCLLLAADCKERRETVAFHRD